MFFSSLYSFSIYSFCLFIIGISSTYRFSCLSYVCALCLLFTKVSFDQFICCLIDCISSYNLFLHNSIRHTFPSLFLLVNLVYILPFYIVFCFLHHFNFKAFFYFQCLGLFSMLSILVYVLVF